MADPQNERFQLDYAGRRSNSNGILRLLVVVFIIALLAGIGFIAVKSTYRTSDVDGLKVECASNLKTLGAAFIVYANSHKGLYPDTLDELVLNSGIGASVIVCPSSNDVAATAPADAFSTPGHCSYIYLAKGLNDQASPNAVLIYEPLTNHGNKGIHLLFADYHVEWLKTADAQKFVASLRPGTPAVWPIPNGK